VINWFQSLLSANRSTCGRYTAAERLRSYAFSALGRSDFYRTDNGCMGILYNCPERFDMPLFLAPVGLHSLPAACHIYTGCHKLVLC
jgi:hypothetical protein